MQDAEKDARCLSLVALNVPFTLWYWTEILTKASLLIWHGHSLLPFYLWSTWKTESNEPCLFTLWSSPPLYQASIITRASGVDMASRHKDTCHNCSMTPQYHTSTAMAPTWPPTKVHDRADQPLIIWVGSSCFESYSNRLHAAVWWKVCLTRCFRLESDPKIEWYRLDLVDYISYWLSSGTQDGVNTENLGKSMFQLKN